ncbi:MAG: FAD-binding oxidoreductase [Candidatus Obscuribacterales bacterium]|nr:FAD-binding oxidoreductase [Candidatus Obscuribacterales bacterium]
MTISFWLDAAVGEKKKEDFDVAIVGSGVSGAASAYWLSRRQGLKVALLDSAATGSGASGRSGGFVLRGVMAYYNHAVRSYGRDAARFIFQLNEQTQAHLSDFVKAEGNSFDYQRCGSYLLASSIEELHDLAESAQLMREDGFEVEYLKEDPLERGFYGALHNQCDIGVNPLSLVRSLIQASSVQVYENESVFRIECNASQGVELFTANRIIRAAKVLLCTNAFLPLLLPEFRSMLKPVRGQILLTRPVEERFLDKLCYANFGYEYFRQLPDGRLLLGGCREPFLQEESSYEDTVTLNVQTALRNYLKDRFPELAGASIDYKWSGIMCFTPDGLPLIGEIHDKPGVFFMSGCNGHGLGYSLALSRVLVETALDGADPGIFQSKRVLNLSKH